MSPYRNKKRLSNAFFTPFQKPETRMNTKRREKLAVNTEKDLSNFEETRREIMCKYHSFTTAWGYRSGLHFFGGASLPNSITGFRVQCFDFNKVFGYRMFPRSPPSGPPKKTHPYTIPCRSRTNNSYFFFVFCLSVYEFLCLSILG